MTEILKDPSVATEHLTPKGKRRRRVINKDDQWQRFEATADARANEIIPKEGLPVTDRPKKKFLFWWQKE